MLNAEKGAEFLFVTQKGNHHRVEKEEMDGAFGQYSEPKKNPRHRPGQPFGAALLPPAQPANECEAEERHIERFDFNQPPLLDHAGVREPDERGHE